VGGYRIVSLNILSAAKRSWRYLNEPVAS